MELFYSDNIEGGICTLGQEESQHCVKVLRHRPGDEISVIDGKGTLYLCRLCDASAKGAQADVLSSTPFWGAHDYDLTLAVCPTKNNDRYEWFAEKATEIGVDRIVPIIGDHSERKVFKTERTRKILVSATKQSLKAKLPEVDEPLSVKEFIRMTQDSKALKLIAYCFEGEVPRDSVKRMLEDYDGRDIIIMIGPEGDFSVEEARLAISCGFTPIHLGASRLRTETAAVTAAEAVYFRYMK